MKSFHSPAHAAPSESGAAFCDLRYRSAIELMLSNFHAAWMNAADKAKMNFKLLKSVGQTMEQLDAQIEAGVKNGYSVETQLALVKSLCARKD